MKTLSLLLLVSLGFPAAGEDSAGGKARAGNTQASAGEARAIAASTTPSLDLTLSFTHPGRIAKVLVHEGQQVKAGEVLVQLDDAVERAQAASLKAQAETTTAMRAAQLQLTRRQEILRKIQKAHAEQAAPERELEEAKIDLAMAELALETSRFQHEQDQAKYQEAELNLQRMRLVSPADADVERLRVREGESVDALAAVLRLVRVAPLWIDVPVPLALGRELRQGQPAAVRLPAADGPATGRVIRVSRVADAASETLEVRLELPNPADRPAGEQVTVQFPRSGHGSPTSAPSRS